MDGDYGPIVARAGPLDYAAARRYFETTRKLSTPPRTGYETHRHRDIAGTPNWAPARDIIAQLREMPASTAEAEVEVRLYNILGFLFPGLRYPELATRYPSGDGPIGYFQHALVI